MHYDIEAFAQRGCRDLTGEFVKLFFRHLERVMACCVTRTQSDKENPVRQVQNVKLVDGFRAINNALHPGVLAGRVRGAVKNDGHTSV